MRKYIIGCGALNWDIFFRISSLKELEREGFSFKPGREYVLERSTFGRVYAYLRERAQRVFEGGGGSSANTIYALSKLGFNASFLGAVGDDEWGEKALNELRAIGVETNFIQRVGTTSLALILLDQANDRTILVSPGTAEEALNFNNCFPYPQALYHFSSYASKKGQLFQRTLLERLPQKISLDPGEIYSTLPKGELSIYLEGTKYLFITEEELKLSGFSVEEIWDRGVEMIFLKCGKRGALAITKNKVIKSSVYPAEKVVDNTGAGDYFNAGVLAGVILKLELEKVLTLGLYLASVSLRDYGRRGLPSRDEFKKFISKL